MAPRRPLPGLFLLLALIFAGGCASSAPPAVQEAEPAAAEDNFESYREVIPASAESDSGLFSVHRVDSRLYFEIPKALLGRDLLLVSRLAKVPQELGAYANAGRKVGERVVNFTRAGDRILLRPVSYESVAPDSLPIAYSVRVNTFEPILAAFEIEALGPEEGSVVVEVTDLFTSDVPALSGFTSGWREELGIRSLDEDRSLVNYALSFPKNVNVRHTLTYEATEGPAAGMGAFSVQFSQSMVVLPEDPMTPRRCDRRVGYFDVERINYGSNALKADEECFINRWRLVPSDMEAYLRGELVEPKEQIVFYLAPGVPERWRPYFKKGIEDWNRAFRAAGFKNVIIAKEAPVDDPNWHPEDVRYSTVRYVASTTRNAMGPSVVDPRTGEILESDIIWYHNHIRSYRNRLMIETAAANPEARTLELPDDLIGETMRQVIAHEVGHALGLPHNMIASSSYPVDSLRSPTFTAKYGVAASIMDYARQNYIAQPGDGVERFIRKIGPYDVYAIEWGYRRFPTLSAEEREAKLDEMIRAHADDPMYRFLGWPAAAADPRAQTEDLGADHVAASRLAVANLKRVVPHLTDWATTKGETYDALDQIYSELLGMWRLYMGHVADVVGGIYADPKMSSQKGPIYTPVPREKQERAMKFLTEYAFEPPTWLLEDEILARVQLDDAVSRMRSLQTSIVDDLLDADRLQRLIESQARWPEQAYPLAAFMEDLRRGVWGELETSNPQIDIYRRNLQRGYLAQMAALLESEDLHSTDVRPHVRVQLRRLREKAQQAAERTSDAATHAHLRDVAARIEAILDAEE